MLDGETHVITGTKNNRPVYQKDGADVLAAGGGTWKIRPAKAYAAAPGALEVSYYFQPFYRLTEAQRDGNLQLNYKLLFRPEETASFLYYVVAWEVDGRVVEIGVHPFPDAGKGFTPSVFGQMPVKAVQRHGCLRAYLFQGGASVRAMGRKEVEFAPLRAALDAGDYAKLTEWLRGPGLGQALPQSLCLPIARSGNSELLELALGGAGAKHAKRDDGRANLLAAAEAGREGCVSVLLKHGADVNAFGNDNGSALSRAIRAESVGATRALLAAGADPEHFAWNDYKEPLRMAFDGGNADLIRLMLDHGLKMPSPINTAGYFQRAAERGQIDTAKLILQRVKDPEILRHEPLLLAAAENGDHAMLDLLLAAGFRPAAPGRDGQTAIMVAAGVGDVEAVKILQKAGASLTEPDKANRTAAGWALSSGHLELATNLAKEAPLGGTKASRLLHDAVLARNGDLISLLLAQDATLDLGASDVDDVVAELVRAGNLPVLSRALSRGLDVDRRFFTDWNLAGMAQRFRQAEVTALLERQAGHPVEALKPAVAKLPLEVFKRGPVIAETDLGQDFQKGEAQVDVYVDADGVPHVPMLRSASTEKIGHAALANILGWRFNRLVEGPKPWRRVIVPFDFSTADLANSRIYQQWEVDEHPVYKARPGETAETGEVSGLKDAAWVHFTISAAGTVISPRVLCATSPAGEEAALKEISSWRFYPARINQTEVACQEEAVILMPGGLWVTGNCWVYFGKAKIEPELTMGHEYFKEQKNLEAAQKRAMVLATFVVDRRGLTKKFAVLGSTDPKYAKLAAEVVRSLRYKPVVIDGVETEYSLALVLAFGNPNDQ